MLNFLRERARRAGGAEVVFAYEASGLGFGLHDELEAAGVRCHVLAPSKIERSPQQRRTKTDEKDALRLLEILRGHVLAGNALPDVWVPDPQTRDDREVVRARLDAQDKCSAVKTQIVTLLKRNGLMRPADAGAGWTKAYRKWLDALRACDAPLHAGARSHLAALLRQMQFLEREVAQLDADVATLARQPRYAAMVRRTWAWRPRPTKAARPTTAKGASRARAPRGCGMCCARRPGTACGLRRARKKSTHASRPRIPKPRRRRWWRPCGGWAFACGTRR